MMNWKEVVIIFGICLEGLRKTTKKTSVRIASLQADV
jgi:hypothetical protein